MNRERYQILISCALALALASGAAIKSDKTTYSKTMSRNLTAFESYTTKVMDKVSTNVKNNGGQEAKESAAQELIIPEADALVPVNKDKDNKTLAKVENNEKSLSRGGSMPKAETVSSKLQWPVQGSLSSGFGMRNGRMHTGIDIAAPMGTPIRAAFDGKVVFSGWEDGYGNLVIIQNNSGLQTYYAHASQNLVKVGQAVTVGQVISKVGTTGRSTGPHVHFEVRKNGSPDNPLKYL